ncbi:MAG: SGNH/GDSL hydrolase family protein [Deltaproteobacteria bacterium]|nr:SGNH/GDSL hydrolase family protein [Deltaproteobacteria bacterium]
MIAAALLLAELGARALGLVPGRVAHPWHLECPSKRHGIDVYPSNPRGAFDLDLRDEATFARLHGLGIPRLELARARTPFAVEQRYNAELCRDREIGARDPAEQRVLVVGDSFTEGQGVRQEATFARRLESLLRDRGRAVEVVNCGRRGYDFPGLFDFFEPRLERYAPDAVLYAMILNDPVQSEVFHAQQAFLDDWILARRRMIRPEEPLDAGPAWYVPRLWLAIEERLEAREVGRATRRWYRDMVGEPNAAGWRQTVELVCRMQARCRERGARFAVALLPLFVGLEGDYPFAGVHETIGRAFTARNLRFHDTLPAFRGRQSASLWVHPFDRHPNEEAHSRIAAELAPLVERLLGEAGP